MMDNKTIEKQDINSSSRSSEKAIFFLRHNNDIDHITPVLYKWLSTENVPTDVIITTSQNLLQDERIKYIKKFKQVRVFHISDLFKKHSFPNIFNRFYFKYDTQFDNLFKRFPFLRRKADEIIGRIAKKLFEGMEKGIVVFDWTTIYFVRQIVRIAKNKKFTTISLPHGDRPYISLLETIDRLNYSGLDSYEPSKIFDYVVVPNDLNLKRYEKFIEGNRIKILGSARYCDEWMEIISDFIPSFNVKESDNKLKIVFFLRNTGYPIFWEEVMRTIKLIMQFKGVYLIVKHHPRNTNAKKLTKKLISNYPEVKKDIDKNLKFIYHGVNSGSLLKWADLIIDLGTSVTWDAVKQNKPVLMLEYLYANYSTIAYYMKTTELRCRDELYDILEKSIENKNLKFYNENERRKFIKEVINVPDKHVLERYCKFLKSCYKEKVIEGEK